MEVKRTLGQEEFAGGLPIQRLAWFGVVMEGDGIELFLGVDAQIRALGQNPAQQAIGVFVDPPFPRTVGVGKEDLNVVCKKEGLPDGLLKAISRAAGSMFGNIILGGGIGAMIDHSNGRGYDYPIQLPVKMGESVVADKRADAERTQNPAKP